MTTQRIVGIILTLLVLIVGALGILYGALPRVAFSSVSPSPLTVQVGKKAYHVKTGQTIWVAPGTYTINVPSDDFLPYTTKITTRWFHSTPVSIHLTSVQDYIVSKNPLVKFLPEDDSADFTIEYAADANFNVTYTITLHAIINRPSELASYNQQLRHFKQEALSWIASKGVDPKTLNITWIPPTAGSL